MSDLTSRVSLDSSGGAPVIISPEKLFPPEESLPKKSGSSFRFQNSEWMVALVLGCLDFSLWILVYYTLSALTGYYNYITIRPLLVPTVIVMGAIALVRGYRSGTDFASLRYASEHLIACATSFPIAAFFLYVIASFGRGTTSSRAILLVNFILFAGATLFIRRFYWFHSSKIREKSKFLVIADQVLGALFFTDYRESGQYQNVVYIGAHDSQIGKPLAGEDSPKIDFGGTGMLSFFHREGIAKFHAIIVAARFDNLDAQVVQRLLSIHFDGIPVYSMENFYEDYWNRLPLELVDPKWVIEANVNLVRDSFSSMLKRFSDLLIATLLLILLAPVILAVALIILLFDGGPVIFSQQRMGIQRVPFMLYKFRTMRVGSDQGDPYTREGDCRVSPLGSVLRRTRLDELPQLWNVLRGEMSLIGPRAEWVKLVETYEKVVPNYHLRHLVRPGITGWAQVEYPYGTSLEDTLRKFSYDLYYIRNYSLKLDAAVLLKTVYVVVFGKGQ
jgi:exopolysaccharide biosynthesis polyprenyl glycosylphosphotransferase